MLINLQDKVNCGHTALLVVDVQNDFCHRDGALAQVGMDTSLIKEMVPKLASFIQQVREKSVPVIFVKTIHTNWTNSPCWLDGTKSPEGFVVCASDSWGAGFYQVSPQIDDYVVVKHRYDAFIGTDLDLVLRSLEIKTLLMSGTLTNVCVESTARSAFVREYHVVFLQDCTASGTLEEHNATLTNIDRYFGTVVTSEEVLKAWS